MTAQTLNVLAKAFEAFELLRRSPHPPSRSRAASMVYWGVFRPVRAECRAGVACVLNERTIKAPARAAGAFLFEGDRHGSS